jgi:hypothetical protein
MPVHIGEITSEIRVAGQQQLPLSAQQINQLVELVMRRLAEKQRNAKLSREATELSREATPPLRIGGR